MRVAKCTVVQVSDTRNDDSSTAVSYITIEPLLLRKFFMLTIYGIPNCDTVSKVLKWMNEHKITYTFHDYKKEGITKAKLQEWNKQVGWEILLNKRSTTWKELGTATQEAIVNATAAITVMQQHTSIIKRPVIETDNTVTSVGFDVKLFEKIYL
jgi:Spx/MgsR family transcriptional regulator